MPGSLILVPQNCELGTLALMPLHCVLPAPQYWCLQMVPGSLPRMPLDHTMPGSFTLVLLKCGTLGSSFQPLSKRGVSNFGHMGATIIDSLDTLFIMGLTDQFNKAKG